jgi:hypothetical protein
MKTFKTCHAIALAVSVLLTACDKTGDYIHADAVVFIRPQIVYNVDKENIYKVQLGDYALTDSLKYGGYYSPNQVKASVLQSGALKVWKIAADGAEIPDLETEVTMEAAADLRLQLIQTEAGGKLQLASDYTRISATMVVAPAADNVYRASFGDVVIGESLTTGSPGDGWVRRDKLTDRLRVWRVDGEQESLVMDEEKTLEIGAQLNFVHASNDSPVNILGDGIEITEPDANSKANMLFLYDNLFNGSAAAPRKVRVYVAVIKRSDVIDAAVSAGLSKNINLQSMMSNPACQANMIPLMDTVGVVDLEPNVIAGPVIIDNYIFGSYTTATQPLRPFYFYSVENAETGEVLKAICQGSVDNDAEISSRDKYKLAVYRIWIYRDVPLTFWGDILGGNKW